MSASTKDALQKLIDYEHEQLCSYREAIAAKHSSIKLSDSTESKAVPKAAKDTKSNVNIPVVNQKQHYYYIVKITDIEYDLFLEEVFKRVLASPLTLNYIPILDQLSLELGWLQEGYTLDWVNVDEKMIFFKPKNL